MKTLGIDIGTAAIKIVEAQSSGKNFSINNFWILPLAMDPQRDRELEILEKLREFTSHLEISDYRIVYALPQSDVATRLLRFPFRERSKVLKSLPFELEEEIPFSESDTVFDAHFVENFSNASDVLAVAAPTESIEPLLARSQDFGAEADLVSTTGFAVANLVEPWWLPVPTQSTIAVLGEDLNRSAELAKGKLILQIGHKFTNLAFMKNDRLVSLRSIEWGGIDLCQSLEATFKVPFIEAVKVLQTKSFVLLNTEGATRDQIAMHKSITDSAQNLVRELKISLIEVQTAAGLQINEILLTGGGSLVQNFSAWLTQSLEVSVNGFNPIESIVASSRAQIRADMDSTQVALLGTAIGLSFEGLRRPIAPAINLRKGQFAKTNEAFKKIWSEWGSSLQMATAIFVVFFVYSIVRDSMALNLAARSDEVLAERAKALGLKGNQATADGIIKLIQKDQKEISHRETLASLSNYTNASDILAALAEHFPVQLPPKEGRGLDVDYLKIDNEELQIEGRYNGADVIAAVEKELQQIAKAGSFKTVTPSHLRGGAKGTPFAFNLKLSRQL